MNNWIREYELIINRNSYRDLDFEYNVEFDSDPEPNVSEIGIYNLSSNTLNNLKIGDKAIFNAGYRGNISTICSGTIANIQQERSGVDTLTKLFVAPGIEEWNTKVVNKTYRRGTTSTQILTDLLNIIGIEVADMRVYRPLVYMEGRTISGLIKDSLKQIATESLSKVYIKNDQVFVLPMKTGFDVQFKLNEDTGMINSPKKLDEGYEVEMLLNNMINVDAILHIESRTANGKFRVKKGKHSGGITTAEVVEA